MPAMPQIGMSVPGATNLMADSGGETEAQRKKRLQALQQSQAAQGGLPGVSSLGLNYGAALGG